MTLPNVSRGIVMHLNYTQHSWDNGFDDDPCLWLLYTLVFIHLGHVWQHPWLIGFSIAPGERLNSHFHGGVEKMTKMKGWAWNNSARFHFSHELSNEGFHPGMKNLTWDVAKCTLDITLPSLQCSPMSKHKSQMIGLLHDKSSHLL